MRHRLSAVSTVVLSAVVGLGAGCGNQCDDHTGFNGAKLYLHVDHGGQPGDYRVVLKANGTTAEHDLEGSEPYACEGPASNTYCYYYDCNSGTDTIDCTYEEWGGEAPDHVRVTLLRDGAVVFEDRVATRQVMRHKHQEGCGRDGVFVHVDVAL